MKRSTPESTSIDPFEPDHRQKLLRRAAHAGSAVWFSIAIALGLPSSSARADDASTEERVVYDPGGPFGPAPALARGEAPPPTAAESCGRDRRCRIERMRDRASARRASRAQEAHANVEQVRAGVEVARRRKIPRLDRPWSLELRASDYSVAPHVSYHPHPNFAFGLSAGLFFGLSGTRSTSASSPPPQEGDARPTDTAFESSGISAHNALLVGGDVRWQILDGVVTPYVGGGLFFITQGGFTAWGNSARSIQGDLEVAFAQGSIGLDVQLVFGLRFRAAFVVRPLVHVRASTGGPESLDTAAQAFESGWRLFGAEGAIGWSL
jgi:hypothetical protein